MLLINEIEGRLLIFGMTHEISSNETSIPSPVVLRIGSGMNSYKATACLDITLKIRFLEIVKDVHCCVQKDDGGVIFQAVFRKIAGVLGGVDIKSVFLA